VDTPPDRRSTCGFCDGTGVWVDAEGDPAEADPCPLCDGNGVTLRAVDEGPRPADGGTLPRLLGLLSGLTQAERQRLYEELHARWDCRIYRR